jgi:signal peptidase II
MRTITRTILASILFLGCVGCDQVTKGVVRAHLALGEGQSFLGDTVRLTHAENSGAFLSYGEALPDHIRATIFGSLRTGIFNVADMVLLAGVALYLLGRSRGGQLNS